MFYVAAPPPLFAPLSPFISMPAILTIPNPLSPILMPIPIMNQLSSPVSPVPISPTGGALNYFQFPPPPQFLDCQDPCDSPYCSTPSTLTPQLQCSPPPFVQLPAVEQLQWSPVLPNWNDSGFYNNFWSQPTSPTYDHIITTSVSENYFSATCTSSSEGQESTSESSDSDGTKFSLGDDFHSSSESYIPTSTCLSSSSISFGTYIRLDKHVLMYYDENFGKPVYPKYYIYNDYHHIVDNQTTFTMKGKELPFVINVMDPENPIKIKNRQPDLDYYVPPFLGDLEFFGGQQHLWQIKMEEYFSKFPDVWSMQGVPFFHRLAEDGWMAFRITTKLRFCCRICRTAWTSKLGKIVFAFTMNQHRRGWIFMKMFGQICMNTCHDWNYQIPACYPEEVDRAVRKLSEYIACVHYSMPFSESFFVECRKSIHLPSTFSSGNADSRRQSPSVKHEKRNAGGNHHRKEFCQACIQGICQREFRELA